MTRICLNQKCKITVYGLRLKRSKCPACRTGTLMNVIKLLKIETRKPKPTYDNRQNQKGYRKPYRPNNYRTETKPTSQTSTQ